MGNRTVSKLRRNMLLKGGLDRAYGKRAVQKIVFRVFLYTLIFGLSFTMLYPLIKVLPAVFGDFATLDDPNVVWIPRKLSVLSFTAAIRIGFGNGTAVLLSLLYSAVVAGIQIFSSALAGYSLGRVRFPMRSLFMVLVVVTIVVPPQTLLIPQYLRFQKFDIFGIFTLLTGEPLNLLNQPYTLYLLAATPVLASSRGFSSSSSASFSRACPLSWRRRRSSMAAAFTGPFSASPCPMPCRRWSPRSPSRSCGTTGIPIIPAISIPAALISRVSCPGCFSAPTSRGCWRISAAGTGSPIRPCSPLTPSSMPPGCCISCRFCCFSSLHSVGWWKISSRAASSDNTIGK